MFHYRTHCSFLVGMLLVTALLLVSCDATNMNENMADLDTPTNSAKSVSFSDSDTDKNEIQGNVAIVKADNESDLMHYVLYWGADATTKYNTTPIATAAKTGSDLIIELPQDTELPEGVSYLLAFTKNTTGEMSWGIGHEIVDVVFPSHEAKSISFHDCDPDADQLAGDTIIEKAENEDYITHYALYWGINDTTKYSTTPVATGAKTGSDLNLELPEDTEIPEGVTHLLVFTKNNDGEMDRGIGYKIADMVYPTNKAKSISFSDSDPDLAQLAGTVSIEKAESEEHITHYLLYWGTNDTTKQNTTPIGSIAKTGSNPSMELAEDTLLPDDVTHLLVFTRNNYDEMSEGVACAVIDMVLPTNKAKNISFSDNDPDVDQLGGIINIEKAEDETYITHYVLYWGMDSTTKSDNTPIAGIAKTGNDLQYTIPQDTAIPAKATHFLVFTQSSHGEMEVGISVAIDDITTPVDAPQGLAFTDNDPENNELQGNLTIAKAVQEDDIVDYALYWATDSAEKLYASPFVTYPKTGEDLTHTFPADTPIPAGAKRFLAFSRNEDGEKEPGVSTIIGDLGLPVNTAGNISFSDSDLDEGEIGGSITIVRSADEFGIEDYVLYWGSNTTTKQDPIPLATLAKTGADLTHIIPEDTTIPFGTTHLLVYTSNYLGEMATGTSTTLTDMTRAKQAAVMTIINNLLLN